MRYWLMSMAVVMFVVAGADSQDKKGKDTPKDPPGKETKPTESKEPYEVMGKKFEEWRKDIKSADPAKRETAMKTITLFGPSKSYEAIRDIIDELNRHKKTQIDLSVRVNGLMALSTILANATKAPEEKDLTAALAVYRLFLKDDQVLVRMRAVQGIRYVGKEARVALPDVIKLANDPATWELRREAIPVMVEMALDDKGLIRPNMEAVLLALKKHANPADEPSYMVRMVAVQGYALVFKEKALVEMTRAFDKDPSKEVRLAAIQGMATAKEKALPNLTRIMDDPVKEYRLQALQTIAALNSDLKDFPKTKDATVKKLKDHIVTEKEPIIRIWTHAVILTFTDVDKPHMDPLLQYVHHKEKPVRLTALQMIGLCGPKGKPFAIKTVLELLEDKDLHVAVAATEVLIHLHAFETKNKLESIRDDKKQPVEMQDAADNALDAFILIQKKELEKKNKDKAKTPEKK